SLSPPLVLICADKASNTLPLIEESGVFAVNLLARDQEELSNRFASKKEEGRRFGRLRGEPAGARSGGALEPLRFQEGRVAALRRPRARPRHHRRAAASRRGGEPRLPP